MLSVCLSVTPAACVCMCVFRVVLPDVSGTCAHSVGDMSSGSTSTYSSDTASTVAWHPPSTSKLQGLRPVHRLRIRVDLNAPMEGFKTFLTSMDGGNKRPVVAVIIVRILNDILTVEPYHPKLLASLLCALYSTGPNGLLELCHLGGYMKSLRAA